jgi:TrmH family RNA methyltransferase
MTITSVNNDRIKELVKLKDKKYRDLNDLFFVEGKDLCDVAYEKGLLREIFIIDGYDNYYDGIPLTYVSNDVMKKISSMESCSPYFGVCAKCVEGELGNKILILDNIQDPGNLGTIIRSAVAFKFDTVVLSSNTVDLYNPKVVRSTKGMLFNMNIIVRDLLTFLPELDGYTIYGTDVTNGINIKEEKIPEKCAIIIGNEGNGISNEVREYCEKFLYIGMEEGCESLNAGVSASILMYEVYNK